MIAKTNTALYVAVLAVGCALHLCTVGTACAQDNGNDLEIEGIITDRTLTLIGHAFFVHFSTTWRDTAQAQTRSVNLTVTEKPSARSGSLIQVWRNQQSIFRTFLPPRQIVIQPVVSAAVRQIKDTLLKQELENKLLINGDLYGEDF